MRLLSRLCRETSASQIAEAALVLPIVFTLLLGIFWVGRAMNVQATINQAARQGARVAVTATCATCGSPPNTPATVDQVAAVVGAALQASRLDPSLVVPNTSTTYPTCAIGAASCQTPTAGPSIPQICVYKNVQLNQPLGAPSSAPPACGVVVTFQYKYPLTLPLGPQLIPLTAESQTEGEN